uniref:Zn(2)-C6 fungal-type domain-containing protein n=1 Tax=Moniliophthora roreri TaxID=221103 RepID=A0A0W0ETK6_MONRR
MSTSSNSNLSSSLHKGKACANCRRRKIRCDGVRPICRPCRSKPDQYGDCEWTDTGVTTTQILEEKIGLLEARLEELQRPETSNRSLALRDPYAAPTRSGGLTNPEDIPHTLRRTLLQNFMSHASIMGFFLEKTRFIAAVSDARLSPSLLDVVYLWGVTLSKSPVECDEEALLRKAVQSVALALANPEKRGSMYTNKLVETIQAKYLIAQYFFHKGRILEGNLHMIAAMSLVMSTKMHQINSATVPGPPGLALLEPPRDAIEEGERIHAFWGVLALNNCWTTIIGSTSNMEYTSKDGSRVDAPWPMEMEQYAQAGYRHPPSSHTVLNFAEGVPDNGTSLRALYAKAAMTLEHAAHVGHKHLYNVTNQTGDVRRTSRCFIDLENLILRLEQEISTIHGNFLGDGAQVFMTITVMAHVAMIELHKSFVEMHHASRDRVVTSAKQVMATLRSFDLSRVKFLDPIMAPFLSTTYQIAVAEVGRLRQSRSDLDQVVRWHEQEMLQISEGLLEVMTPLSSFSPLFATHLARMQSLIG